VEPVDPGGGGVRAKGANFVGFRTAVRELFGEQAWGRVLAAASPELRAFMIGGELKTGGWYSVASYRALHAAAATALPMEPDLARRVGHAAMCSDLSGIYRVITYFLSPHSLVARAAPIFGTYWEGAQMQIERLGRSHVRVELRGCDGFDRRIWSDIFGGIVASLEQSGAREVELEVLSGCGDEPACSLDIRWQLAS